MLTNRYNSLAVLCGSLLLLTLAAFATTVNWLGPHATRRHSRSHARSHRRGPVDPGSELDDARGQKVSTLLPGSSAPARSIPQPHAVWIGHPAVRPLFPAVRLAPPTVLPASAPPILVISGRGPPRSL